jgi:SAM-dependent methyltransferase
MTGHTVDYDRIAAGYDARYDGEGMAATGRALLDLTAGLEAGRILEAGCGTGHWLSLLAAEGRALHGLDLSAGMLRRAWERKAPLKLARGKARRLPFREGTFDLVFCVNALHHFFDARAFVNEAYRLLHEGGILAIAGNDPHGHRDSWYGYDYFEGTWEADLARFPAWETVSAWMTAAGFAGLSRREVERIVDPKRGRAVLDSPFLQKGSCSQLALLSDEAYAAGLQRLRNALDEAEARGEELLFRSEFTIEVLQGRKQPELQWNLP